MPINADPGSDKDRVLIFDTTLRDGEQCPGATMTLDEKERLWVAAKAAQADSSA